MLTDQYNNLSDTEKERFSKVANYLLNRTYLTRETYEAKDKIGKINADYRFVERNLESFEALLGLLGYTITKDDSDGIIMINNSYLTNLVRLDKFTTLLLITLRQIYDEQQEKAMARNVVFISISEIIVKMIDNKFIAKKPTIKEMVEALRILIKHNIIARFDGDLESSSSLITIYPTIHKAVSNEKIETIYNNLFRVEEVLDEPDAF